jgi:hypothetical protein
MPETMTLTRDDLTSLGIALDQAAQTSLSLNFTKISWEYT